MLFVMEYANKFSDYNNILQAKYYDVILCLCLIDTF